MRIRLAVLALIGLAAAPFALIRAEERAPAARAPGNAVAEAAERTLAAGPMHIDAIVQARRFGYRIAGRLDPAGGYRLCGPIRRAPNRHWLGVRVWLEGQHGAYGTLTAHGGGCTARASWIDDHPPTLPFERRMIGVRGPGAEDYLHAALVGLAGLAGPALGRSAARDCGSAR